jgi:hypothetical protein
VTTKPTPHSNFQSKKTRRFPGKPTPLPEFPRHGEKCSKPEFLPRRIKFQNTGNQKSIHEHLFEEIEGKYTFEIL